MRIWIVVGIVLQVAMVLIGHRIPAVAQLFAPLGMGISLAVAALWARSNAGNYAHAGKGGAVVGGSCALIGISISLLLGDVIAWILLIGTTASTVTGALGGLAGFKLRRPAVAAP